MDQQQLQPAKKAPIKWPWSRKQKETVRVVKANDPEYNKQFKYARLANAYFLGLLILQSIPQISSLNPITTIVPLSLVVFLKASKDLIDDVARHRSDRHLNNRPTILLRNGNFCKQKWSEIQVGDIIKLESDEFISSDLLLLGTSEPHGLCYIETAELDGETNLKVKQALSDTAKTFERAGRSKDPTQCSRVASELDFVLECEPPNERLDEFEGTLKWRNGVTVSINNDNILLRGCRLRNTKWCYGLVVFAGSDTKLMKNGGKTTFKQTHIDRFLNYLIIGIVGLLLLMCLICMAGSSIWESVTGYNFQVYLPWPEFVDDNKNWGSLEIGLLTFLSYMILLNTVVPISLYVSFMINWDSKMYYEKNDIPANARTTTLNEELGQIEYIFSDKTGTLTQNIMTFNKCSINGKLYGYIHDEYNNEVPITDRTLPIDLSWNRYSERTFNFYDQNLIEDLNAGDEDCKRFFTLLSVCHTLMAEMKQGELIYQAQSPDENALVSAARNFGFVFKTRTPKTITVSIQNKAKTFEVLNILDFNNVRKRMSVICRIGGKLILYCKGADTVIKERIDPSSMQLFEKTEEHLNKFAEEALRTLCLAWKEINEEEYQTWSQDYHAASTSLENRADKVSECYERIEQNLLFIGATAIEDKLQDGVPECIAKLAKANIKIWVLTGDKQETAINIGYSCQLLTNTMEVFVLNGENEQRFQANLQNVHEQINQLVKENQIDLEAEKTFNPLKFLADQVSDFSRIKPVNFPNITVQDLETGTDFEEILSNSLSLESQKSRLLNCALVINGQSLVYALKPEYEKEFLEMACICRAVICCRVTPGQKKAVVDLVKNKKKAITLAVGDGANDVSMIKSAHIGVGISGQEGQQAVLASDFSIGQFRYLERLLLVHGRWSYYRISKFLRYFFYKNFASTLCQFWFAFFCGFSAHSIFDPVFASTYNVFYSSLPIVALGVFDQDVNEEMSLKYPSLYLPGQKGTLFSIKIFLLSIFHGILTSMVLFFFTYFNMTQGIQIQTDTQTYGFVIATTLVIVVNLECGIETSHWTFINHISIWGSIVFYFTFFLILYADFMKKFILMEFVGVAISAMMTIEFWLTIALEVSILILPIIAFRYLKLKLRPSKSDSVRMLQARLTRTRTHLSRITSARPKRSAYAFSHQEGFGTLIGDGSMIPDEVRSPSNSILATQTTYPFFGPTR